jgi:DNA-binding NarL/FixJ family response regulator
MEKAGGKPMNVFVVEDAPEIRRRLVAMVRMIAGINVIGEAESVSEAIEGVLGGPTDMVLLDLQLKDGTGLEVLARVKQARPELRVIVLTNFATPQYRQASLSAGAEFCLDKSREFGLVPGILRNWLEAAGSRPVA